MHIDHIREFLYSIIPTFDVEKLLKLISQYSYGKCTSPQWKKHMKKYFYKVMLLHRTVYF
jgi:hypothetical protein